MEYEVLQEGRIFQPYFTLWDGEGVRLFSSLDRDPAWCDRPRPKGIYTSTAWIPGDLLNEGLLYVSAAMKSLSPMTRHFHAKQVVAFQVVDKALGGGSRGSWGGDLGGVIRPMLEWETSHLLPEGRAAVGSAI
jgi:lipopolysaccharide transport system ATP-binding protein